MKDPLLQLFKEIEKEKSELLEIFKEVQSLHDERVIKLSQDLDRLIVQYQKIQLTQRRD
ncbi:aspartyl-phosphate phosphatase Spo0E family protein [Ammoniphilus sp. 3BR4]|uniref:aspartyl-phosphate phosphatase Spo0E family protein n=1 Tax=Ammoniphilus sp. 3BR4 TaxID=3158265 RepID=UPI0034665B42